MWNAVACYLLHHVTPRSGVLLRDLQQNGALSTPEHQWQCYRLTGPAHGVQHNVEDTKAGKYEKGRLLITTLRIMWFSSHSVTINLCIGIQTIHKVDMSSKARSGVYCISLQPW